MPKRQGRLRSDEYVEPNIFTGERRIKRERKSSIFGDGDNGFF